MNIYHRTDIYNAYRKVVGKQTWSKDPHEQANFHTQMYGGASECKDEITLHFKWTGPYVHGEPLQWPGPPNILHIINWGGDSKLWSMVLFPGTNTGLTLTGYSNIKAEALDDDKHKQFVLNEVKRLFVNPIDITVPVSSQRNIIPLPELPTSSVLSKLLGKLLGK